MKMFGLKKRKVFVCVVLTAFLYLMISSFVYATNLGRLAGDIFREVAVPADELYVNAFTINQIDWEMAYWSAMTCEYTYEKKAYPLENLALSKLGFTITRQYSFYERNGKLEDDLMVDVGVKEISTEEGEGFTVVALAFRGSVPAALKDPTSKENMRRNMAHSPKAWKEVGASVHGGFYDQYRDVLTDILPELNTKLNLNILQNENVPEQNIKFWITGHSMGAALAELFAIELIENGVEPERVITYGFATPLLADQHLKEYAQSIGVSERIYKLTHKQDMVAFIGYGILFGESLAAGGHIMKFGRQGIFDRSHHSLPRIYLPFIISQNSPLKQKQFQSSLLIEDM